jgi:ankyrin repeat protein
VQQHVARLNELSTEAANAVPDILVSLQGLLTILMWAVRHRHDHVCEQLVAYFVQEAPRGAHLLKLAEAHDGEGNSVLHALALAGKVRPIPCLTQRAILRSRLFRQS